MKYIHLLAPLCAGCGVRVPRPAGPAGHHEAAVRQAEAQQPPPRPRHPPVQPQQVRENQQRFVLINTFSLFWTPCTDKWSSIIFGQVKKQFIIVTTH